MQTDEGLSQIAFRGVGQVHLGGLSKERAECRKSHTGQYKNPCKQTPYNPTDPPPGAYYAIDLMKGYSDCATRPEFDRYGAIAYVAVC